MRIYLLFFLLLLISGCVSPVLRRIASVQSDVGPEAVDIKKSQIRIFPSVDAEKDVRYYFYMELRNQQGQHIDCNPEEIELKTSTGKAVRFQVERLLVGRYYLTLKKNPDIAFSELNFSIQGQILKKDLKLNFNPPDKEKTKIILKEKSSTHIVLELHLRDQADRPVESTDSPDIIVEGGYGSVANLRQIREGVWEFTVNYPNENQLMYFSVRALDVYLPKLFRYQHVEK